MHCNPNQPTRSLLQTAIICASAVAGVSVLLGGQQSVIGPIKDFKAPQYYPAPNQNQLKWLLTGSNAVPQGTITRLLLDHVNLESFKENGERDLQLEADSCLFDSSQRTISSDGHIKVQTANGRLLLEGTGFFWQATNSNFTISNKVHTIIKRPPAAAKPDRP